MWQLLPFDDLARYQQLGYNTHHLEWITVTAVLGLASGLVSGFCSKDSSFEGVITLLIGFIGFTLMICVIQMNEMSTAPYMYAQSYEQIETRLSYLRVSACIIAYFLCALITHVGAMLIQSLVESRRP